MRKIPKIMFTQHPDNAGTPYWHDAPMIKTHHEPKECVRLLQDFGQHECMWDWEGKLVDESVIERLYGKYHDFFSKNQIGKDVFLTFRIPNPRVESGFRLGRAFLVILSAREIAKRAKLYSPPLFEVILPLTESAKDLIDVHQMFENMSNTMRSLSDKNKDSSMDLEVIPLFESVETILNSKRILTEYVTKLKKSNGVTPKYLRPFVARSDPSLNSGIVATTLAIKWALSEYKKFEKETKIKTFTIIGPGVLPFRGGLRPDKANEFMKEFAGIRTICIQSSFRYDYPMGMVRDGINEIEKKINKYNTILLQKKDHEIILRLIEAFEKPYRETVESIAPKVQYVAAHFPQRRERVQHIGLFGYSRTLGKVKLPRAISFTGSCYSLGIPPELFGVGQGLTRAKRDGHLLDLEKYYPGFRGALKQAGRYLRKDSISELGISSLEKEIPAIEEYLGEPLGPNTKEEKEHVLLSGQIVDCILKGRDPSKYIESAAKLRKSLG